MMGLTETKPMEVETVATVTDPPSDPPYKLDLMAVMNWCQKTFREKGGSAQNPSVEYYLDWIAEV